MVDSTILNPLVSRMTPQEHSELRIERIELRKRDVLARLDEPQPYYIFMERGLVSTVRTMADDRSCITGHIAPPGMVGISSFFLTNHSVANYVVTLPGEGLRVERERLRRVVHGNRDLTVYFQYVAHVAWVMNGLTSACNRLHEFEPRLCRWLMTASNAIDASELPLSQTEVARLLGVSRQQMRVVVQKLVTEGKLRTVPGRITLVDKAAIAASACECYRAMARRFAQISNASRNNDFFVNVQHACHPRRPGSG